MLKMVDVYSGSPRSYATLKDVDIVMVKATQGTGYVNPNCDVDYQAKKAGKLLGFYHYCGGGNPENEAEYFYKNTKNYTKEAVPAVDWEEMQNSSWGDYNYVKRFVQRYHTLSGVYPLIYVQQSAIAQVANCASMCGLWVAWYASMQWYSWNTPNANFSVAPWVAYTIWQFTGDDMDRNVVNVSRLGWQKIALGDNKSNSSITMPKNTKSDSWVDSVGDTWHKKNGTFKTTQRLNLRWGAKDKSSVITTLPVGSVVKYDAYSDHDGYRWIRQPRSNGQYAYLPVKNLKTGKEFGK